MTPATLEEIRAKGLKALAEELGHVGMVRFLQMFETGRGDYSKQRHKLLGKRSVRALAEEIKRRRNGKKSK